MAASGAPQWLQTVNKKHLARENAINSFLETHKTRLEVLFPAVGGPNWQSTVH
jgi:hypothetical protein